MYLYCIYQAKTTITTQSYVFILERKREVLKERAEMMTSSSNNTNTAAAKDGVSIWDSLASTSDSRTSHQEISLGCI